MATLNRCSYILPVCVGLCFAEATIERRITSFSSPCGVRRHAVWTRLKVQLFRTCHTHENEREPMARQAWKLEASPTTTLCRASCTSVSDSSSLERSTRVCSTPSKEIMPGSQQVVVNPSEPLHDTSCSVCRFARKRSSPAMLLNFRTLSTVLIIISAAPASCQSSMVCGM